MLTQERLNELFTYDAATGNLIRKVAKANQPAGSVAGSVNARGHVNVMVDGGMCAAHRIVFLMVHGWLPVEIDHINRVKTDNRIENLRPATSSQNKGNVGLSRTNASGYRGVSRNSRSGKWHAQIKINGKQTYLGRRDTPEEAALLYNEAATRHFGEFALLNEVRL
jgi:hypothetical protein